MPHTAASCASRHAGGFRVRRQALRRLHTDALSSDLGAAALCKALAADGIVLLRLPPSANAAARRNGCLTTMREFFDRPRSDKSGCAAALGPGCQVGYMINERDEIFEAKVFHDSRWPWPRGDVQRDVLAMRELLHTVALACLRSLAAPLGLDAEKLHAHLDRTNPHDGSLRGSLEHCSNTSMRIYRYAARGLGNNVHTDNTLLTVSPPGSAIGLCASMPPRPDGQGGAARSRVVRPEAHMAPDELLLFAGDALSFLSRGRIPALVHWVEAPPGEAPRFSMPFFLRPRLDALLDPDGAAAAGPVKVGNPAGDVDERAAAQAGMIGDGRHLLVAVPPLQPVLQRAIEANVHNVRRSWPWKQGNDYYAPAVYPSDEGHAPVAVQLLTT